MRSFNYLRKEGNKFYITKPKDFNPVSIPEEIVDKTFEFAYNMSFGKKGAHRDHRTGGQYQRKNGEIFINTFQGKTAEYGFYLWAKNKGFDTAEPDLQVWELGEWDQFDFEINNKKVAVKSTKFYGNLLLLETGDWNSEGKYIPNLDKGTAEYDYIVLVRVKPDGEKIMKTERLLYENECDKKRIKELITGRTWETDIPGFICNEELIHIINAEPEYIIPKDAMLQGKIKMDAENYYVQAGDLNEIENLQSGE